MARYDFRMQRLFVDVPLTDNSTITLDGKQANYLKNVLRMSVGAQLLMFNGADGEWLAELSAATKRNCELTLVEQTRPQSPAYAIHYLFAPLKSARLDYVIQKAVEMGVGRITPVITQHTQVSRLKQERVIANAIEAAEQCGILNIPIVDEPIKLDRVLDQWSDTMPLVYCDEHAEEGSKQPFLQLKAESGVGLLIGPEGGFSSAERERLLSIHSIVPISLGPRILRADTAAVAALAYIQSTIGDWNCSPSQG